MVRLILSLFLMALLTACSVGMAARTGGIRAEDVQECQTRECFVGKDKVEVLEKRQLANGGYSETYKFQLKRGSAGRAAMHGLLDVATLGIWEVVGTPIEATKKKKYIVVTANYNAQGRLTSKGLGTSALQEVNTSANPDTMPTSPPPTVKPAMSNGVIIGAIMENGSIRTFEDDQTLTAPKNLEMSEYLQPAVINGEYAGVMLTSGDVFLFKDQNAF